MQFSIRRPKLPSSEIHPEESLYRRLDVSAWLNHLNDLGQVEEEYRLRQVWRGTWPASTEPFSQAAGTEGGWPVTASGGLVPGVRLCPRPQTKRPGSFTEKTIAEFGDPMRALRTLQY